MAEAKKPDFLQTLINSLKDSFDALAGDVSKGNVGNIYDQLTRGPGAVGRLPIRAVAQRFAPAANDLISLVMNMAQPTTAQGIIGPVANPRMKALFEALREKAPGLVKKAEGLSETVYPYLMPRELMPMEGTVGSYRRSATLPKGELYVRGGRPSGEQTETLAHELRHFLTSFDPAIATKSPMHAGETASQIANMLPQAPRHGLQSYTGGLVPEYYNKFSGTPETVLKQLRGGAEVGVRPPTQVDPHLAFDEAMSYLTEALLNPRGGDPALTAVAEALGQGIK